MGKLYILNLAILSTNSFLLDRVDDNFFFKDWYFSWHTFHTLDKIPLGTLDVELGLHVPSLFLTQ